MRMVKLAALLLVGSMLWFGACDRTEGFGKHAKKRRDSPASMIATWYDVPADSVAQDRASEAQFTAASDRYKIGTLLRVTRTSSGKSVEVKVTDTGLKSSKSGIDVCRGAAEKLGMVSDGVAKVTVEVIQP